ncbi:helix-turn-helix transcriptional regulator, partial [Amycolatopsis sp. SID8362]|uniref:helix-turn-helix transcriptional regulator n=1 Tax=Amycolatopsis sp. SID8362 TaxID=2690346 RepID=UPI0014291BB8
LTADPARRAERAVAAADVGLRAGDLAAARASVDVAERDARDEFLRARAHLVRSQIAFSAGLGSEAPPMLLAAAQRLEPFDPDLARETYLQAWGAAALIAADGESLLAISRAIRDLPPPEGEPRPIDLVLAGYGLLVTDGRSAAVPVLERATAALVDLPAQDVLKWGWVGNGANAAVWDDQAMRRTYVRAAEVARTAGALTVLPIYLASLGIATTWTGDFAGAAAIVAEAEAVATATGVPIAPHTKLLLTAMQGKETEAAELIAATVEWASQDGQLMGVTSANWAAAVLYNGLARYEQAIPAAQVSAGIAELWVSVWVLPELIEAAVRVGEDEIAHGALDRLTAAAEPCDTDWAQGILQRSRALLSDESAADRCYREAIERLGRTKLRPELARAHLLYGEWLRRQTRRLEAREHLRAALDMFASIGMDAFAERARRELLATGEKVPSHTAEPATGDELTPQERQIALLVREGFSNSEVGAQLFLSPRTVEWHLRKIFTKLSITSRRQLRDALSGGE